MVYRKRATASGDSSRKFCLTRYSMPISGWVLKRLRPTRKLRFRSTSSISSRNSARALDLLLLLLSRLREGVDFDCACAFGEETPLEVLASSS